MTVNTYDWESPILSLAYDAIRSNKSNNESLAYDKDILDEAYAHCEAITSIHSRSFSLASGLLPGQKQQAARALYAFCLSSDNYNYR